MKLSRVFQIFIMLVVLAACGKDVGVEGEAIEGRNIAEVEKGILVGLSGLEQSGNFRFAYEVSTTDGGFALAAEFTDTFFYVPQSQVTFYIVSSNSNFINQFEGQTSIRRALKLGSISANDVPETGIITPLDFFGGAEFSDQRVINFALFLEAVNQNILGFGQFEPVEVNFDQQKDAFLSELAALTGATQLQNLSANEMIQAMQVELSGLENRVLNPLHTQITDFVLGRGHGCAVANGALNCWGDNDKGQLEVPRDLGVVTEISAGGNSTCAIDEGGLVCWGASSLADIPGRDALGPQSRLALSKTQSTSSASPHSGCVLRDNQIACWGFNPTGLPNNLVAPHSLTVVGDVGCLIDEGKVHCFGDQSNQATGVPANLGEGATHIALMSNRACALTNVGLECWSDNPLGSTSIIKPVDIAGGESSSALCVVDEVASDSFNVICSGIGATPPTFTSRPSFLRVSQNFACALDGATYKCWGVMLDESNSNEPVAPELFTGLVNVTDATLGANHACILSNGNVQCAGLNTVGQTTLPRAPQNMIDIVAAAAQTCVADDLGVQCWGQVLAEGTPALPVRELALVEIALCARSDNDIECFSGTNFNLTTSLPPVFSNPISLSSDENSSFCAIDDTGVKCWGLANAQSFEFKMARPTRVHISDSAELCVQDSENTVECARSFSSEPGTVFENIAVFEASRGRRCGYDGTSLVECDLISDSNNGARQAEFITDIGPILQIELGETSKSQSYLCFRYAQGLHCAEQGLQPPVVLKNIDRTNITLF